jgi:hypothetical protein
MINFFMKKNSNERFIHQLNEIEKKYSIIINMSLFVLNMEFWHQGNSNEFFPGKKMLNFPMLKGNMV